MARDVEQTKRLAREAALAEFAEHGREGTTMERIARRAGVNKERIYTYFGDKAALFGAVVHEQLVAVAEAVPLELEGPDDLGAFAGATYDYLQAHPDLARLTLYEGLADRGAVADEAQRTDAYRPKIEAVRRAQRRGLVDPSLPPAELVFLVLALASWWSAAPQTIRMLTAAAEGDGAANETRRRIVVEAASRIGAPSRGG